MQKSSPELSKKAIFVLVFTLALAYPSLQYRACASGEFAMMLYGNRRCRPCGTVYKNCNECSPSNLNKEESFCNKCKFFHKTMGWNEERSLYRKSLSGNNGYSFADSFGWECKFNWQLLIFTLIGVFSVIGLIVFNYIKNKKERRRLEEKKRREKEREYGRLV